MIGLQWLGDHAGVQIGTDLVDIAAYKRSQKVTAWRNTYDEKLVVSADF